MNQTNKEAFNEFARGATFVIVVMGVVALFIGTFGTSDPTPEKRFEVVDTYKGCDVVRYTDRSNSWNYFLDCGKGG
jgi:hypothetical protein